jgi:hypothetical protein
VSSDTPPSIPPRGPSGRETGKPGAAAPKSSAPAPKSAAPAKPASSPARPSTATTPAGTAPARTSAVPARTSAGATSTVTATQEAPRPAPRTTSTPASSAPLQQDRAAAEAPAKPAARPAAGPLPSSTGPRRVRLAVSRVDPWSVMKLSFLVSVAIGIMIVVASAVVWLTLDSLEVFARLDGLITEILADSDFDIMKYVQFDRVISVSTLIAVVDVFLMTALATIGAFLYNIVAALVGGVHVTMTDD